MKKEVIFLVLILFLIFIKTANSIEITGNTITGEIITGEAIGSVDFNITVIAPPVITITNPENKTYLTNISLPLNFTADPSIESIWYNLDLGTNTTITSNLTFNTSQGSHILYLFANNTNGNATKNVTFFINSSKLTILYSEYNGSLKGTSTDFITYPYEDLQNLNKIILENLENGKIQFNEAINITDDENFNDNLVDLDSHTNLSFNRIELNTTALPNFNKSSTLWLYNLTFTNPKILLDGEECDASICTQESYSAGVLKFNITKFGIFTTEETPVLEAPPSEGGRTINPPSKKIIFEVNREIIKVQLKIGEKLSMPLKITNKNQIPLEFSIESNLNELLEFSETEFTIKEQQEKEVMLNFHVKNDSSPGVYSGKIIIKTQNIIKEIPVIIEAKTKKIIFDVSLDIPPEYKEIYPGEDLVLQVTIFNLGEIEEAETLINYFIKDLEGNIIYSQQETITVKDQASFTKTIKIPKDLPPEDYISIGGRFIYSGKGSVKVWDKEITAKATNTPINLKPGIYVAGIEVKYDGTVGVSSDIFEVKEKENFFKKNLNYIIIILLIIAILIIILILKHEHKKIKKSVTSYRSEMKKQTEKNLKKRQQYLTKKHQKSKKIKEKLNALEQAYSAGHISKDSYIKSKKRIKELLKNS